MIISEDFNIQINAGFGDAAGDAACGVLSMRNASPSQTPPPIRSRGFASSHKQESSGSSSSIIGASPSLTLCVMYNKYPSVYNNNNENRYATCAFVLLALQLRKYINALLCVGE